MKKDLKIKALEILRESGVVKNDGEGNVYIYKPEFGTWEVKTNVIARREISKYLQSKGFRAMSSEIKEIFDEIVENVDFEEISLAKPHSLDWICVKNGRVNIKTLKLEPHSPNAFDRIMMNFEFDPKFKRITGGDFANFVNTSLGVKGNAVPLPPKVKLFLQILGYAISNRYDAKKAFIFLGPSNCGKSMILKLLGEVVGAYVPLSFRDLTQRFRGSLMKGAHLILCHEVQASPLKKLDVLKSIISGDPIIIEEKCVQPETIIPKCKIIMAANVLPSLGEIDGGNAFIERLIVLPFDKATDKKDVELLEKLKKERDMIFSLAIYEFSEVIKNGMVFECPESSREIIDNYKKEANSVVEFLQETYELGGPNDRISLHTLAADYEDYCDRNLLHITSRQDLRRYMIELGYNLKKARIFGFENPVSCVLGLKKKNDISQK